MRVRTRLVIALMAAVGLVPGVVLSFPLWEFSQARFAGSPALVVALMFMTSWITVRHSCRHRQDTASITPSIVAASATAALCVGFWLASFPDPDSNEFVRVPGSVLVGGIFGLFAAAFSGAVVGTFGAAQIVAGWLAQWFAAACRAARNATIRVFSVDRHRVPARLRTRMMVALMAALGLMPGIALGVPLMAVAGLALFGGTLDALTAEGAARDRAIAGLHGAYRMAGIVMALVAALMFATSWLVARHSCRNRRDAATLAPQIVAAWAAAGFFVSNWLLLVAPPNAYFNEFVDRHLYVPWLIVLGAAFIGALVGTVERLQKVFRFAWPLLVAAAVWASYAVGLDRSRLHPQTRQPFDISRESGGGRDVDVASFRAAP